MYKQFEVTYLCVQFNLNTVLAINLVINNTPYESFRFLYGQDILDLWHIRYIKPNDVILKPSLLNQFFKKEGECHDVH